MVRFGNWIFHYRNFLFPVFYLLLFIPSPSILTSDCKAFIIGMIISLCGEGVRALVMGFVNIQHGGKDRTIFSGALITGGIFAHCRNPLYIGNILILLGLAVAANSLLFLVVLIPLFIFFYQAIVLAEEAHLEKSFGTPYQEYKTRVNRWWPAFKGIGKTLSSMHFNLTRVLVKEYNSTYLWMTGAVLLAMKQVYVQHGGQALWQSLWLYLLLLLLLGAAYFFIRYMKKTQRWRAD